MTLAEHQSAAANARWAKTPKNKRAKLARKAGLASAAARKGALRRANRAAAKAPQK